MKKFLLLFTFCALIATQSFAEFEFNFNYNYSRPAGQMMQNIRGVHGLNMLVGYQLKKLPLTIGVDVGYGGYGYQTQRQAYTFDDGSITETNVNVSNNIFNLMLNAKIHYPNETAVQPYVQFRGGLSSFYTTLVIEDPEDIDACRPLESTILKSSSNLAGSVGIGMKINLSKSSGKNHTFGIDIGSNYVAGGRVNYMSLNKSTTNIAPVGDVSAEFINTHHQVTHKHHVGYIYNTPIRFFDWHIGMYMQF